MALRYAVANGNWSSTATWNGGASIPGNGDTVAANGFTVTIDQAVTIGGANNPSVNAGSFVTGQWYQITTVGTTNFTTIGASANTVGIVFQATGAGSGTGVTKALATITTAAAGAAAAGGGFTASTATMTSCNVDVRAGTTACLTLTGASALTMGGANFYGGSAANAYGINHGGSNTLSFSSATISGGSNGSGHGVFQSAANATSFSSCTFFTTVGNGLYLSAASSTTTISGSTIGNSGTCIYLFSASSSATISSSTITGGTSGNVSAIQTSPGSTLTITGSTINGGSSGNAFAINVSGAMTITSSTVTASTTSAAIWSQSSTSNVSISGILIGSASGYAAVYGQRWNVGTSPTGSYIVQSLNGTSTTFTWYAADYSGFGQPAITDVRSGTVYASGALTGTCAVPAAASVAYGTPVDNTTGTAVLTAAAVQSALTSQGLTTTRAAYLDNLNGVATAANQTSMSSTLSAVKAKTDNLPASPAPAGDTTGLTAYGASTLTQAQSQSAATSALTAQGYTSARAGYLDTLNGLVSAIWAATTRTLSAFGFTVATNSDSNVTAIKAKTDNLPASPAPAGDTSGLTAYGAAQPADITSALTSQGLTSVRAGKLDNLDAAVSTRLASSGYTAPDNTSVAAIKAKTDNLPAAPSSLTKADVQAAVLPLV